METNKEDSSIVEGVDVDEDVTMAAAAATTKEQVPELTAELFHSVFSNQLVSSIAN